MSKFSKSTLEMMQQSIDDLKRENKQLKSSLVDMKSMNSHYDRRVRRMIDYWRDLTGYEMTTPTIDEAAEYIIKYASRAEALQEEIDELTEKIDEINVSNEFLMQRLGQYE
jgi:phage host-nuclease inhibitor protein Gam